MIFLDCPAYPDQEGTVRCGLPAQVRRRFIMSSTDGPRPRHPRIVGWVEIGDKKISYKE